MCNYISNPKKQAAPASWKSVFNHGEGQVPTAFPCEPGAVTGLCRMCSQVLEVQGQAGLWVLLQGPRIAVGQGLGGSWSCPPPPHPPFPWSLKLHLVNGFLYEAPFTPPELPFSLVCVMTANPSASQCFTSWEKEESKPTLLGQCPSPPPALSLPGR